MGLHGFLLLIFSLFFVLPSCLAMKLCTNGMYPNTLNTTLAFCGYNGTSCCNAADDAAIHTQFTAMNVSDSTCAGVIKSILCAKCDPYAAEFFDAGPKTRTVPLLCSYNSSSSSAQSNQVANNFCQEVWDSCKDIAVPNSPFNSSTLSNTYTSEAKFCSAFGGTSGNESLCFNGMSAAFSNSSSPPLPKGLCLERIDNGSYLNMAAHPDGSNRAFFSNQAGKIWLATIPEYGSGGSLQYDESNPFIDLTDEVTLGTEFGLMGVALHPNFVKNGRFFVSYNCDKSASASCSGRCSCNSDVNCDPSKLPSDNGAEPCQYQSVVAEYSANDTSLPPSNVSNASPSEVRRIFTMGLPFTNHHAGQILFGPEDGYLYFVMGDGGNTGDPYNFAQNKKSLLGKIMRLDVDHMPSAADISKLVLWGNYSIPKDNPFTADNSSQGEIWALGFRNPWRCSFDLERPEYFYCADVGQISYEEVDLVVKGGNYGWRVYEGDNLYSSPWTPGGNTSVSSINPLSPVMGYGHNSINSNEGSASITGGYVYRAMTDPCMYGRYLYADLYGQALWAGIETPENSGNYTTTLLNFTCAVDSPIACDKVAGSSLPSLGYIFSYGQDNQKDVYILTSKGVYRIVAPSRCSYSCAAEKVEAKPPPPPHLSSAYQLETNSGSLLTAIFAVFLLLICYYCLQ